MLFGRKMGRTIELTEKYNIAEELLDKLVKHFVMYIVHALDTMGSNASAVAVFLEICTRCREKDPRRSLKNLQHLIYSSIKIHSPWTK